MKQGTPEWHEARLGKVTASRIADVMAKTKSGYGAGRKNYMAELLAERLTGTWAEGFTSAAMQHGTDTEPMARAEYEFATGTMVEEVGFVQHPTIEMSGASPDGFVGYDGMVEIKCPNTATHLDTLINRTVDLKYMRQMQWQMVCAERNWCDFVSYDNRLPEEYRLCIIRFERIDSQEMTEAVELFLRELDELIREVKEAVAWRK